MDSVTVPHELDLTEVGDYELRTPFQTTSTTSSLVQVTNQPCILYQMLLTSFAAGNTVLQIRDGGTAGTIKRNALLAGIGTSAPIEGVSFFPNGFSIDLTASTSATYAAAVEYLLIDNLRIKGRRRAPRRSSNLLAVSPPFNLVPKNDVAPVIPPQ